MQLSVFRGGFTLEAAEAVAGATPDVLAALAGKSFLQRRSPERHELHPLLQHYAAEKLAASPVRRTSGLERHSRYYLTFLERHRTALVGAAVAGARAAIEGEIENVRAAWHWAVTHAGLA